MKTKSIVVLFVALALGCSTLALAQGPPPPAYACDNEDFHVNVPAANDIHITYYSDTPMKLDTWFADNGWTLQSATASSNRFSWEVVFSGPALVYSQTLHVGVCFKQATRNYLKKKDIYWTWNGAPVPGGNRPGPGFRVFPPFDYPPEYGHQLVYRIVNTSGIEMRIRDLQLMVQANSEPLSNMLYGNLTGWDSPRAPFILADGDSAEFPISVPPALESADSFYVFAQGVVDSGTVWSGHFVQQHEHTRRPQIPTLNTWGLVILLLLLLAAAVFVVRRRVTA